MKPEPYILEAWLTNWRFLCSSRSILNDELVRAYERTLCEYALAGYCDPLPDDVAMLLLEATVNK